MATQFSQLSRWSFHYLASLGIAVLNTILLIAVFRFKNQDGRSRRTLSAFSAKTDLRIYKDCLAEAGQPPSHEESSTTDNSGSKYKQMFRLRSLHFLAFFALLYVGVEVTLGGKPHPTLPISPK